MNELIANSLAYPTVFFTVFALVSMVYWLFVILGGIGLDVLDFDLDVDGALEGADAISDGAIDGVLEGALDGAMEGAADGAAEAADGTADSGPQLGVIATIVSALKLRKAPITVSLSLTFLFGWLLSYYAMTAMPAFESPFVRLGVGTGVGFASFAVALIVASFCIRPLGPIFEQKSGQRRRDILGKTCTVRTGRVDEEFGQAEVDDGGAGLLVEVRCPAGELKRGDKALVVEYDSGADAFIVEPMSRLLGEEDSPQPKSAAKSAAELEAEIEALAEEVSEA